MNEITREARAFASTCDEETRALILGLCAWIEVQDHTIHIMRSELREALTDANERRKERRDALRAEVERLTQALTGCGYSIQVQVERAEAAERKAEAAERKLAMAVEALEKARNGIAVLGDVTKHLGLQEGYDAAAKNIERINAVLTELEKVDDE